MNAPARLPLASLPTPLLRLTRAERHFRGAQLWIKRDDLTGLELSGNKIRKLEFVLADARQQGCDTIVTEGTPQSNHCRATAAACARLGLHCVLLLRPAAGASAAQGNHLLDCVLGAEMQFFERPQFDEQREAIVAGVLEAQRRAGRRPRWTPMGASEPLGALAYLHAGQELITQLRAAKIAAADVIVAVSSGGTFAGLALAEALDRSAAMRVWAVPVSDDASYHRALVQRLCQETSECFALNAHVAAESLRLIDGYVGSGYAKPYAAANACLRSLARDEAILLDPVYTAKAFCALLDGVRAGRLGFERPAVFVHTGGIFSNFAWPELLLENSEA